MPIRLSTTLSKLKSANEANKITLQDFSEYMLSKELKSEHHIVTILVLLISFDRFLDGPSFTSINNKEQILTFLEHQYKDGRWVKREKDVEVYHNF